MRGVHTMILGSPANDARREAVEGVMSAAGFEGPVTADLHAQGGGVWFVLVGVAPAVFLKSFLEAAGEDAWKALKEFFGNLAEALDKEADDHGQIYVRRGGVTAEEWEAGGRRGPMPGLRRAGDEGPEICIDSLLPDDALFAIDPTELEASSFRWDRERGEWEPIRRV